MDLLLELEERELEDFELEELERELLEELLDELLRLLDDLEEEEELLDSALVHLNTKSSSREAG
jgi:hypothetical protein